MIKKLFSRLALILTLLIGASPMAANAAGAKPLDWAKNKYGIHITGNYSDLDKAAKLLNSHGGDWSWVTVVVREDELEKNQWQTFFDICRRRHLIPIVRIATKLSGRRWEKPQRQNLELMADFLTKLNWPTKNKFVIVYNEPNRADEWGGRADPKEYAIILSEAGKIFKSKDTDFYIISAGLDLAAPNQPPRYYSAENFYRRMIIAKPDVFKNIDSLGSHSYPNHGFIGGPNDSGKTSVRGYRWELDYLKSLGVKKSLTVFITETGWPHQEGRELNKHFYQSNRLANLFKIVFKFWEQDKKVIAFTPFILNYPYPPFDHFSWQSKDGQFYPQSQAIGKAKKRPNRPPQTTKGKIIVSDFAFILIPGKRYLVKTLIKNTGQSIWGEKGIPDCFKPKPSTANIAGPLCQIKKETVSPGQSAWFKFNFTLAKNNSKIAGFRWENIAGGPKIKPLISPELPIFRRQTGIWEKMAIIWKNLFRRPIKNRSR